MFQLNVLRTWSLLTAYNIKVIVFTDDEEWNEKLHSLPDSRLVSIQPIPEKNPYGTPFLKAMFLYALEHEPRAAFYGYANGDILFEESLVNTLVTVLGLMNDNVLQKNVFLIGQRTNVYVDESLEVESLLAVRKLGELGALFETYALDYFFTTREGFPWEDIPDFVVGRIMYDQWLVDFALDHFITVVDCTNTLLAVHQTGSEGTYARGTSNQDTDWNIIQVAKNSYRPSTGTTADAPLVTVYDLRGYMNVMKRDRMNCQCQLGYGKFFAKLIAITGPGSILLIALIMIFEKCVPCSSLLRRYGYPVDSADHLPVTENEKKG